MTASGLSTCFPISRFKNKNDTTPKVEAITWASLCNETKNPIIRQNKDGTLLCPACFDPPQRDNDNVKALSLLIYDIDHNASFAEVVDMARRLRWRCMVHTSHSHKRKTKDNPQGEERIRVIIELASPVPVERFSALWHWGAAQLNNIVDQSTKDPARMYYSASKHSPTAEYEYCNLDGEPLDWRGLDLEEEVKEERKLKANKAKVIADPATSNAALSPEDEQVIALATQAIGDKFVRLMAGDSSDYLKENSNEPDRSRADFHAARMLFPFTDDDLQIERILKNSGRDREWFHKNPKYLPRTIESAREWLAEHEGEGEEDITTFIEVEDDDPPISDNPKREAYLRKTLRNGAKVNDTSAIILRLSGFEKNHSRILNALHAIGGDRLGVFKAYQASLRERYACTGEASSEDTVRRDLKKLREEQAALGVRVLTYKPGTRDFNTGQSFPCKFQNHLLRYTLQAVDRWLDGLEEARKQSKKLTSREKRELLEEACRRIVESIPRSEPVKPKEKSKRFITVDEMKARFVEIETRLIETYLSEGWSESEIEQEFEWLENRRQGRLKDAIKTRIAELPIRVASCNPYREPKTETDLEVQTVQ